MSFAFFISGTRMAGDRYYDAVMERRLAAFLVEESVLEESASLPLTHERIAGHLGTAREVVTRMLRYFQSEGMVHLSRGRVTILDETRLRALAGAGG